MTRGPALLEGQSKYLTSGPQGHSTPTDLKNMKPEDYREASRKAGEVKHIQTIEVEYQIPEPRRSLSQTSNRPLAPCNPHAPHLKPRHLSRPNNASNIFSPITIKIESRHQSVAAASPTMTTALRQWYERNEWRNPYQGSEVPALGMAALCGSSGIVGLALKRCG